MEKERERKRTVMEGWVARDGDGSLVMFSTRPKWDEKEDQWFEGPFRWVCFLPRQISDHFPMEAGDEPVRARLTLEETGGEE